MMENMQPYSHWDDLDFTRGAIIPQFQSYKKPNIISTEKRLEDSPTMQSIPDTKKGTNGVNGTVEASKHSQSAKVSVAWSIYNHLLTRHQVSRLPANMEPKPPLSNSRGIRAPRACQRRGSEYAASALRRSQGVPSDTYHGQ